MIRIMVKHPDGSWLSARNTNYEKDAEKLYAKSLVGLYRNLMDNGYILCFIVEIQTTIGNRNFVETIGRSGI